MRRMLLAAAFALAFHGWLLSSQSAWLLPGQPIAAVDRSIDISLTSAPQKPPPAKGADKVPADPAPEPQPPPPSPPAAEAAPPPATASEPEPKPAAAAAAIEPAPPPPPEPAAAPAAPALPAPDQFAGLFDAVRPSSPAPFIPEGIAALSKTADGGRPDTKTPPAARPVADDPVLTEASPLYRENPPPLYPRIARRRGYQGTVLLAVLVDETGRVEELKISESSGYAALDRAAETAVRGWRFDPGRKGESPVEMWVTVPVRFEIK